MAMTKLFVYGTLKKGHGNHGLLSSSRFLGEAKTDRKMWGLVDLGYFPAMTYGELQVQGEVYEVDDATLERIDMLEGVNRGLYERHTIVIDIDGEKHECDTYLMFSAVTLSSALQQGQLSEVW